MSKTYPAIKKEEFGQFGRCLYGVWSNVPVRTYRLERSTSSGTSPGYPILLQENSFSTQTSVETWRPGSQSNNRSGNDLIVNLTHEAAPRLLPPSHVSVDADYTAKLRMFKRIPEVTANLALLYAERAKTYESVVMALGGIVKAVREVRRGRPPELFMNANQLRNRKRMSGAWLNYTYGIAPLASDLHAIALSELKQETFLSGRCIRDWDHVVQTKDRYERGGGSVSYCYKFALELANPITASLAGAGLTNPALIAWELTPFSFMADWVLPIGPYLEMLSSSTGFTKKPGSTTVGIESECMAGGTTGALATSKYKHISRNTMAWPSVPLPRLKNPLSPVHGLNLLSIIHQQCKDHK